MVVLRRKAWVQRVGATAFWASAGATKTRTPAEANQGPLVAP